MMQGLPAPPRLSGLMERTVREFGERYFREQVVRNWKNTSQIRRYLELGCEVKGMGRGHIKRIKDSVEAGRKGKRKKV